MMMTALALAAAPPANFNRIEPLMPTIFYADHWETLPIDPPSSDRLSSLPIPSSGTFGMMRFTCAGIGADRALIGCKTNIEPIGQGYEAVAVALLSQLRVSASYALRAMPIKFISVTFRVSNAEGGARSGPCWPEVCVREPSPPPLEGLEWTQGMTIAALESALGRRVDRDGREIYVYLPQCVVDFSLSPNPTGDPAIDYCMVFNAGLSIMLLYPDAIACLKANGLYRAPTAPPK